MSISPNLRVIPQLKKSEAEREYASLQIFLSDDVGFRLGLATFDRPATRDGLMSRLTEDLHKSQVLLTALDVHGGEGGPLLRRARNHLADVPTPEGWQRAIAVINLEDRLNYSDIPVEGGLSGARDLTFLQDANFHRDAFVTGCPCPLLLWLTKPAETALAHNAPDLWHWRSARFDFEGAGVFLGDHRAHPAERKAWFEKIVTASHSLGDERGGTRALVSLGNAKMHQGDSTGAIRDYEAALTFARGAGDRRIEGTILGNLGHAWRNLGAARKSIDFFSQELTIARLTNDKVSEGAALGGLGIAWRQLGDLRKALDYQEQRLAITRKTGDRPGESQALGNLGTVWHDLGEQNRAISFYEQDLAIAREMGNRRAEGMALGNLSAAWSELGDQRKAIDFSNQFLVIARDLGDRYGEGVALGNLGNAWAALGNMRKAMNFYHQHLSIAHELCDPRGEGTALYNLSRALWELGKRTEAIESLKKSLVIHRETEDPWESKITALLERLESAEKNVPQFS